MSGFIHFKEVYKRYKMGETTVTALDGINFEIEKGEFVIIVGPSGAGKSTVLNILGGMDTSDEGEVIVDGSRVDRYNREQLIEYRRYDIGFVFQFYNLMQNLTALENVELASQICKKPGRIGGQQLKPETSPGRMGEQQTKLATGQEDPMSVITEVGLASRAGNFPAQLSGGEQQRVSIARALAKSPKLLLCDEPTGALDYVTGKEILKLLQDTCRQKGMTVIVITHNTAISPMADRIIKVRNGKVAGTQRNMDIIPVEGIEW